MTRLSRRALLGGMAAAFAAPACRRGEGEPGVLRVGLVANLTHGPMLAALASGSLERAVAPLRVEARLFRAGPRVVEALIGGAIDVGITGPAPVVFTHARHGAGVLRVVAGCASGGASLLVRKGAKISSPADFRGRSIAVVQVGCTQDVALRTWLAANGLASRERGGDVAVYAFGGAVVKGQMAANQVDAAWMPEPWATRLVQEIGAERLIDERALWEGGRFASAIAVTRADFAARRANDVTRYVEVLRAEVASAIADPARTEALAYEEIRRRTANAGPRRAFHDALSFIDFTSDCMEATIQRFADNAAAVGIGPSVACSSLFEPQGVVET